jgi:hypothetical protein
MTTSELSSTSQVQGLLTAPQYMPMYLRGARGQRRDGERWSDCRGIDPWAVALANPVGGCCLFCEQGSPLHCTRQKLLFRAFVADCKLPL